MLGMSQAKTMTNQVSEINEQLLSLWEGMKPREASALKFISSDQTKKMQQRIRKDTISSQLETLATDTDFIFCLCIFLLRNTNSIGLQDRNDSVSTLFSSYGGYPS
jgi:Mg2+ and Co2+ transporter CorA